MTTIVAVRKGTEVALAGDGQVSMGQTVSKGDARKVRRISDGNVIVGFAGSTADAFTLLERLEGKLDQYKGQLTRACVELAKDWRTDRYLRKLEALMIVADVDTTLMLSGLGDVIEPEALDGNGGVIGIGSGGNFAFAAAKALYQNTDLSAAEIAEKALTIAGEIDVYTNNNLVIETLGA